MSVVHRSGPFGIPLQSTLYHPDDYLNTWYYFMERKLYLPDYFSKVVILLYFVKLGKNIIYINNFWTQNIFT